LGEAEIGYEIDTKKIKVGNGLTSWNSLAYVNVVPSDLVNTLTDYVLVGDVGNAGGPAKLDSNGNLLIPKSSIILEGSAADDFETTLTVANATADRTITFRDQSGTVALLSDIDALVDGAPGALNTLNELSAALDDDENYAATITTALGVITQGGIQHTSSTTDVHGIGNTANLATKTYADTAATGAANTIVGEHNTSTTNVHGIADTADLMTKSGSTMTGNLNLNGDPTSNNQAANKKYVDDEIVEHNSSTTNIHGIADTQALATKTYADNTATTIATTIATDKINLLTTSDIEEGTNLYFTATRAQNQAIDMMSLGTNNVVTDSLEVSTVDFHVGQAAKGLRTTDEYTNPIAVFSVAASDYAQVAIKNTTDAPDSSSDLILYSSNGNDAAGYIDIGITAPSFSDPSFTITGGNDGYIFMEAPKTFTESVTNKALTDNVATLTIGANDFKVGMPVTVTNVDATFNGSYTITAKTSTTFSYAKTAADVPSEEVSPAGTAVAGVTGDGNLVIATGGNGTHNHIVFAAGGLQSNNTQMTIFPDVNVHIEIDTPSTSPTTGALTVVGGVGIQGDLNIEGDVDIQGTIVFGGAGTTVETANLSVTDPLIFTGDGNAADIVDLGFIGEYTIGGNTKYSGIVRDASDGVIKAFKHASTKPTSTVNFSEAGLEYSDLQVAAITASSITAGDVSNTEFGYLNGVTSGIQSQLNNKAPIDEPSFTGLVSVDTEGIEFADGIQSKEGVPSRTPIVSKTSSYTLSSLSERDSLVEVDSPSAVTITIPNNSSVPFPVGTTLDILGVNTGLVTIAAAGSSVSKSAQRAVENEGITIVSGNANWKIKDPLLDVEVGKTLTISNTSTALDGTVWTVTSNTATSRYAGRQPEGIAIVSGNATLQFLSVAPDIAVGRTITISASSDALLDGTVWTVTTNEASGGGSDRLLTISQAGNPNSYTAGDFSGGNMQITVTGGYGLVSIRQAGNPNSYTEGQFPENLYPTVTYIEGAVVNATPGLKLRAQWSSCTLFKRSINSWVVYGDLKA
jgi:hypothetical protein